MALRPEHPAFDDYCMLVEPVGVIFSLKRDQYFELREQEKLLSLLCGFWWSGVSFSVECIDCS